MRYNNFTKHTLMIEFDKGHILIETVVLLRGSRFASAKTLPPNNGKTGNRT